MTAGASPASPDLAHIEMLNHLGRELSLCSGSRSGYALVADRLRRTLGFARVSLWTCDARLGLVVKEAWAADEPPDAVDLRADEQLMRWQMQHRTRFVTVADGSQVVAATGPLAAAPEVPIPPGFRWRVLSLPVLDGAHLLAVLNCYASAPGPWYFDPARQTECAEFFLSVGGMMEVYLRTKALEAHTTFYKEVHHRVKNNLQTVASLLRMQLRRVDRMSAERALADSIGRIESIALVHETLSQCDIGLVDLGDLVGRVARLAVGGVEATPSITLDRQGSPVMLTSKQATALALVANELVQNAVLHAGGTCIDVTIRADGDAVRFVVEDDGVGLPSGFAPERDGGLGLTIVRELSAGELSGEFALVRHAGRTRATVTFPASLPGVSAP